MSNRELAPHDHSGRKALGCSGGVLCGSDLIQNLHNGMPRGGGGHLYRLPMKCYETFVESGSPQGQTLKWLWAGHYVITL